MKNLIAFCVALLTVVSSFAQTRAELCSDNGSYNGFTDDQSVAPGESLFSLSDSQRAFIASNSSEELDQDLIKSDLLRQTSLFVCNDNSEGQGTANEIAVVVNGTSCLVKYVYGYEYGNEENELNMFDLWPDYAMGFNCKIVGIVPEYSYLNLELSRFNKTHKISCGPRKKEVFETATSEIRKICL